MSVKILCLFVRHGATSYPEALGLLDRWYEKHGLTDQRTLWIVDNALSPETPRCSLGASTTLRPGDNGAWEFSAWEHAIGEARKEGVEFDVVHFVTSAFNALYTGYLEHFFPAMLDYSIERKACLGHIDSYPTPIRLGNTQSQAWTRTCFFFLPWSLALTVSPWAAYRDASLVFASIDSRQFNADAPIERDYQSSIAAWLEGREMGGHSWHSPVRPGAMENVRFQSKTLAILNEHSLAITFRKAGIQLVDFCWLHSFQTTPIPIIADPPTETDQVNIRRIILGFQKQDESPDHAYVD